MKRKLLIVTGIIIAVAVGTVAANGLLRRWTSPSPPSFPFASCNFNASWEDIKGAIGTCQVELGLQLHSLTVGVTLTDGRTLCAKEPEIDAILHEVKAARPRCGRITMMTE